MATAIGVAQASARASATAIAEGFAEAMSCNCSAATEFFATATDTVFVEAVARSNSSVMAASMAGGSDTQTRMELVEVVKNETLVAFSEVLIAVSASAADGCTAVIEGTVVAGDSVATCSSFASGESAAISVDASATAGALSCRAYTCPCSTRLEKCLCHIKETTSRPAQPAWLGVCASATPA